MEDTNTDSTKINEDHNLKLIKTLWGIDEPISSSLFKSVKEEGYHGVEVIRLAWLSDEDQKLLIRSLNEANLAVVLQVHTAGGYLNNIGEYIYCGAYNVEAHKLDFQKQLQECKGLLKKVSAGASDGTGAGGDSFINVHAGVDAWSKDEALEFLNFCLDEIEKEAPTIKVTFETHRQRLFGSPFQTRDLLSCMTSRPELKLNADLSHWYCACERVFNANDDRDKQWWPDLVSTLSERCEYIHARFGWANGPQMADPSAAECEADRVLQMSVWKSLMDKQMERNGDVFISPEYGPNPYMAVMPHTQEAVSSLPAAVSFTKKVIEELYADK